MIDPGQIHPGQIDPEPVKTAPIDDSSCSRRGSRTPAASPELTLDREAPSDAGRRRFLGMLGAGAAASAVGAVGVQTLAPAAGAGVASNDAWGWLRSRTRPAATRAAGRPGPPEPVFGRIFHLPSFAPPSDRLTEALNDIGKPGGILDAKDDLSQGPIALAINPALSVNNRDNPRMTAGVTFLGQFIDHDVTFDASSELNVPTDPALTPNLRSPVLDLDSVYGLGPVGSAKLYQPDDLAKLRIASGGKFEDLPRTEDGTAIIADPRNDQTVALGGLHAAFILFHNRVVDFVRSRSDAPSSPLAVFAEARRIVTWHYQWIVRWEFVPLVIGDDLAADITRRGRRWYRPATASMPVEFQGSAYRFGHSMVRPSYRANVAGNPDGSPFVALTFDPTVGPGPDPADLRGGARAPRRFIGWESFFDFGDGKVGKNKRIDTHLSTPLFQLPIGAIASRDLPISLPQRTLLRHVTWSVPSGQAIAWRMGVPALSPKDLADLQPYGLGLERSTPLWFYVLKEAELLHDGLHLGPVGGRIVGEVLVGLIELDPNAYLNADPRWRPTLPQRNGVVTGEFAMTDLLAFAGVDPASRNR